MLEMFSLRNFFFFAKVICLFYLPDFRWGMLLRIIENCPVFSQVLFFTGAGQVLLESGLPPYLLHILLLLLAVIFSFVEWKVFLKFYPASFFTVKGLLADEELAKSIAWLLDSKLWVNSLTDIAGFCFNNF